MTRADPDQPQGQPYPPNTGNLAPQGYQVGAPAGQGYGGPGHPAPVSSPADADTTAIPRDGGSTGAGFPGASAPAGVAFPAGPADGGPANSTPMESPSFGPLDSTPTAPPRKHSRVGAAWVAVVIAAIVLIFLLIFILQNSEQVQVEYLGWAGTLSLGVAMTFAAIAGALTVGLLGTVRILQLRKRAKRAGG